MPLVKFGDISIDTASDGHLDLNLAELFPDVPRGEWAAYPEAIVGDALRCPLTSYLVRAPGATILVDTGLGPRLLRGFEGECGRLLDSLAAAGVTPEMVDAVVTTHMHPDHIGWNCKLEDGAWLHGCAFLQDPGWTDTEQMLFFQDIGHAVQPDGG